MATLQERRLGYHSRAGLEPEPSRFSTLRLNHYAARGICVRACECVHVLPPAPALFFVLSHFPLSFLHFPFKFLQALIFAPQISGFSFFNPSFFPPRSFRVVSLLHACVLPPSSPSYSCPPLLSSFPVFIPSFPWKMNPQAPLILHASAVRNGQTLIGQTLIVTVTVPHHRWHAFKRFKQARPGGDAQRSRRSRRAKQDPGSGPLDLNPSQSESQHQARQAGRTGNHGQNSR
jgi:hypothetical protein